MNIKYSKQHRFWRLESGFTKNKRFTILEIANKWKINYGAAEQRLWHMQKAGMILCNNNKIGGNFRLRKYWFT